MIIKKRLDFFIINCEWKLDSDNITICVKSKKKYIIHSFWDV